jgi:hypothetical protein
MDAHQTTTTSTRYAAIHPRFPVGSLAQNWVPSLPEALLNAAEVHKVVGRPVQVMSRTVTSTSTYEDLIVIGDTSRKADV